MGAWDKYAERISSIGSTKREASLKRGARLINDKIVDSLSYQTVTIDDVKQQVAIINSDNLNEKSIISLPGEDITHGGLVQWMDNHWLVVERDANTTLYTRAKLIQCNHLLKWVTDDGVIHEQWCIIEDGTKYLTGELEDRNFIVTRGDSRIAMTIQRNKETIPFNRNYRFLIDDPDSPHKLSYTLSKPIKLGASFNGNGVFKFVLQEVTATGDDNHELGIADYYKYFPKNADSSTAPIGGGSVDEDNEDSSKGWL